MHKSVPKVPKVLTNGKVSQKIPKNPKFWGGGVRPVLDEVQFKAAFFFEKLPNTDMQKDNFVTQAWFEPKIFYLKQ